MLSKPNNNNIKEIEDLLSKEKQQFEKIHKVEDFINYLQFIDELDEYKFIILEAILLQRQKQAFINIFDFENILSQSYDKGEFLNRIISKNALNKDLDELSEEAGILNYVLVMDILKKSSFHDELISTALDLYLESDIEDFQVILKFLKDVKDSIEKHNLPNEFLLTSIQNASHPPLCLAALSGDDKVFLNFINSDILGLNSFQMNCESGYFPIHYAFASLNHEIVDILLKNNCYINLRSNNDNGQPPALAMFEIYSMKDVLPEYVIKTKNGKNRYLNEQNVITFLTKIMGKGMDLSICDQFGNSILEYILEAAFQRVIVFNKCVSITKGKLNNPLQELFDFARARITQTNFERILSKGFNENKSNTVFVFLKHVNENLTGKQIEILKKLLGMYLKYDKTITTEKFKNFLETELKFNFEEMNLYDREDKEFLSVNFKDDLYCEFVIDEISEFDNDFFRKLYTNLQGIIKQYNSAVKNLLSEGKEETLQKMDLKASNSDEVTREEMYREIENKIIQKFEFLKAFVNITATCLNDKANSKFKDNVSFLKRNIQNCFQALCGSNVNNDAVFYFEYVLPRILNIITSMNHFFLNNSKKGSKNLYLLTTVFLAEFSAWISVIKVDLVKEYYFSDEEKSNKFNSLRVDLLNQISYLAMLTFQSDSMPHIEISSLQSQFYQIFYVLKHLFLSVNIGTGNFIDVYFNSELEKPKFSWRICTKQLDFIEELLIKTNDLLKTDKVSTVSVLTWGNEIICDTYIESKCKEYQKISVCFPYSEFQLQSNSLNDTGLFNLYEAIKNQLKLVKKEMQNNMPLKIHTQLMIFSLLHYNPLKNTFLFITEESLIKEEIKDFIWEFNVIMEQIGRMDVEWDEDISKKITELQKRLEKQTDYGFDVKLLGEYIQSNSSEASLFQPFQALLLNLKYISEMYRTQIPYNAIEFKDSDLNIVILNELLKCMAWSIKRSNNIPEAKFIKDMEFLRGLLKNIDNVARKTFKNNWLERHFRASLISRKALEYWVDICFEIIVFDKFKKNLELDISWFINVFLSDIKNSSFENSSLNVFNEITHLLICNPLLKNKILACANQKSQMLIEDLFNFVEKTKKLKAENLQLEKKIEEEQKQKKEQGCKKLQVAEKNKDQERHKKSALETQSKQKQTPKQSTREKKQRNDIEQKRLKEEKRRKAEIKRKKYELKLQKKQQRQQKRQEQAQKRRQREEKIRKQEERKQMQLEEDKKREREEKENQKQEFERYKQALIKFDENILNLIYESSENTENGLFTQLSTFQSKDQLSKIVFVLIKLHRHNIKSSAESIDQPDENSIKILSRLLPKLFEKFFSILKKSDEYNKLPIPRYIASLMLHLASLVKQKKGLFKDNVFIILDSVKQILENMYASKFQKKYYLETLIGMVSLNDQLGILKRFDSIFKLTNDIFRKILTNINTLDIQDLITLTKAIKPLTQTIADQALDLDSEQSLFKANSYFEQYLLPAICTNCQSEINFEDFKYLLALFDEFQINIPQQFLENNKKNIQIHMQSLHTQRVEVEHEISKIHQNTITPYHEAHSSIMISNATIHFTAGQFEYDVTFSDKLITVFERHFEKYLNFCDKERALFSVNVQLHELENKKQALYSTISRWDKNSISAHQFACMDRKLVKNVNSPSVSFQHLPNYSFFNTNNKDAHSKYPIKNLDSSITCNNDDYLNYYNGLSNSKILLREAIDNYTRKFTSRRLVPADLNQVKTAIEIYKTAYTNMQKFNQQFHHEIK